MNVYVCTGQHAALKTPLASLSVLCAFRVPTFITTPTSRAIQLPARAHLSSLHSGPQAVCNSVALAAVPDSRSSARCQQRAVPSCTNLMYAIFFLNYTPVSRSINKCSNTFLYAFAIVSEKSHPLSINTDCSVIQASLVCK